MALKDQFARFASLAPTSGRMDCLLKTAGVLASTCPKWGLIAQAAQDAAPLLSDGSLRGMVQQGGIWMPTALGLCAAPLMLARSAYELTRPTPRGKTPVFMVMGMPFREKDIFTSILIVGTTGCGKTSSGIYPLLDEYSQYYNEETEDEFSLNPAQKWGGMCLDVKGEFAQTLLWFVDRSGRNVLEDVKIIRPVSRIPVVKLQDPDTGNLFYVSALGSTLGNEAERLILTLKNDSGAKPPRNLFSKKYEEVLPFESMLKAPSTFFDVAAQRLFYVGWRYDGDQLVRVSHTPKKGEVNYLCDAQGQRKFVPIPKRLRFLGIVQFDNGLHYNIIKPNLPAAAIAERLALIGKLVSKEGTGGDNSYFYNIASSHLTNAIQLFRLVKPEQECTAPDVVRLTDSQTTITEYLKMLEETQAILKAKEAAETDPQQKRNIKDLLNTSVTVLEYYRDKWNSNTDEKSKNIAGTIVRSMFAKFANDTRLQETFCQTATISFGDCIQKGHIFAYIPGEEYEDLAKVTGTALKLDFQKTVLDRLKGSDKNKTRRLLLVVDEFQRFAVAGGSAGAGDEDFGNLARQALCGNINATQGISWLTSVVGREQSKPYLMMYGGLVFFRSTDDETFNLASTLSGTIKAGTPRRKSESGLHWGHLAAMKAHESENETQDKPRYSREDVINLDTHQAIVFNGGVEGKNKMRRFKGTPHWIGGTAGTAALVEFLRWYDQASVEQALYHQGRMDEVNAVPTAATGATAPTTGPAAQQSPSAPSPTTQPSSVTPPVSSPPAGTPPPTTPTPKPPAATSPQSAKARVEPMVPPDFEDHLTVFFRGYSTVQHVIYDKDGKKTTQTGTTPGGGARIEDAVPMPLELPKVDVFNGETATADEPRPVPPPPPAAPAKQPTPPPAPAPRTPPTARPPVAESAPTVPLPPIEGSTPTFNEIRAKQEEFQDPAIASVEIEALMKTVAENANLSLFVQDSLCQIHRRMSEHAEKAVKGGSVPPAAHPRPAFDPLITGPSGRQGGNRKAGSAKPPHIEAPDLDADLDLSSEEAFKEANRAAGKPPSPLPTAQAKSTPPTNIPAQDSQYTRRLFTSNRTETK